MTTVENVKATLVSIISDGKEPITVSDGALAQFARLRKLLVDGTGYDEKNLQEDDLALANFTAAHFDVSMFESSGATIDSEFGMLMPTPDDMFEKHVVMLEKAIAAHPGVSFIPSILVADYILQHKIYYR